MTQLHDSIRDIATLEKFEVEEGNSVFSATEDGILIKDGSILYRYPEGKSETSYIIPEQKTFTMANVIQALNKPTLILAHNKTLAVQLYSEFKEFFPHNAVEYFVS